MITCALFILEFSVFLKKTLDKFQKVYYNVDTKGREITKMYEYEAYNLNTKEETTLYGYSFKDVCRRANLNPEEWSYWMRTYID